MKLECASFKPDVDALLREIRLDPTDELNTVARELIRQAELVARPKSLVLEAFVEERGAETVKINGVVFTSRVLRANLADVDRVFVYVATCGAELDTLRAQCADPLLAYLLDCIKAAALQVARKQLRSYVINQLGTEKIASMNPGSGDADVWPIQQQAELFQLLGDVEAEIGVRLAESFLMEPNKTVSGVFFPTEKGFVSCQLCRRERCHGRRAPFDEQLWRARQAENA